MKMLLLLFFVGYVYAAHNPMTAEATVDYFKASSDMDQVIELLKLNVLSMDGNIPLLVDRRRHYAIIFHVLYSLGSRHSGCFASAYAKYYQLNINVAAPDGIRYPELVINKTNKFINDYYDNTVGIRSELCANNEQNCNSENQNMMPSTTKPREHENRVLQIAGEFANSFINKHEEFIYISGSRVALQYIIEGASKLEDVIRKFTRLLWTMKYPLNNQC